MPNDDNRRQEKVDAAASHSADTMSTADASGFLMEPIHPTIVAFANLPVPESCDDLPPLHILEGDNNIYEYMVQRADATARVVSQLARHSKNSQTPITTHYATVFQYDVTVYGKIARHARSTARWLLTRCARRSSKDGAEQKEDAERAAAADYNTTRALVETARTAAVRLETSLVLARPALASLLQVVAASTAAQTPQQGSHRRSRSQTTTATDRPSNDTADGSAVVGQSNKSAVSEKEEDTASRSASSSSAGGKQKGAVVVQGTLLHRLQQQARLNSVLAVAAAAAAPTTATQQHPTPAGITGRSDGGGDDDVRMSMMPSPATTGATSVGEKAHHRSTRDEPPAAKRSRASPLPPSEAEAAKVNPASHHVGERGRHTDDGRLQVEERSSASVATESLSSAPWTMKKPDGVSSPDVSPVNTLDEAHQLLSGGSSDDDDDDDDHGL